MGDDGLVLIFLAGRIGDGEGRVGLVLVVDVEFVVIGFLAVRPADGIAILGLDVGRQGRRTIHAQSHVVEFVNGEAHAVLGSIGHVDGIVFGVLEIAAVAVGVHVSCRSRSGDIDGILIGTVIILIVLLVFSILVFFPFRSSIAARPPMLKFSNHLWNVKVSFSHATFAWIIFS